MLQRTSQRDKEGHGRPKSLVEQGYIFHVCVNLYIVIQGNLPQEPPGGFLAKQSELKKRSPVNHKVKLSVFRLVLARCPYAGECWSDLQ